MCMVLLVSCGGSKITTTDDWVALCGSTTDVKVIDKAFLAMEPEAALDIFEDLLNQIVTDDVNSPLMKDKCEAMSYLWGDIVYHNMQGDVQFSQGQKLIFVDLSSGKLYNNASSVVTALIGFDGFLNITSKFNKEL